MKTLGLGAGLVVLMGVAVACEQAGAPSAPAVKAIGLSPSAASFNASADRPDHKIRWDILHISSFSPLTINGGGMASAKAADGSQLTLTGSGTFKVHPGEGNSEDASGGGTWVIGTKSGTYRVTGFVSFQSAPGTLPAGVVDHIGSQARSSGLAVLRVAYSDGDDGVLVVSCDLPVGSPPSIVEGIAASKGFTYFWNVQLAVGGVDGNRTLFHVID